MARTTPATSTSTSVDTRTNTLNHKGARIPLAAGDDAGGGVTSPATIKDTAIRYNPKLDPKYDARSMNAGAFTQGGALAFDPRAGKGASLIGHELTHVVQQ